MKYYIWGEVNQWLCVAMRATVNGNLVGDGNTLKLNYGMVAWLYRFTKHHQTVHFFSRQIIQYWILYHNKVAKTVLENQSPYLDILSKCMLCGTLPLWDIDLVPLVESISSLVIDLIFNLTHRKYHISQLPLCLGKSMQANSSLQDVTKVMDSIFRETVEDSPMLFIF